MKYQIWRHHVIVLDNATFEECKAFLIERDSRNANAFYKNCIRAMASDFDDNACASIQGALWCSEYASIKPTDETQIVIDQLNTKARMEETDKLLTWGE